MQTRGKRKTLREIVDAKKWSEDCPVCMSEMDYIELSKVEKLWAPSEYAWECLRCPTKVRILDGHIDPKKGSAVLDRCREENRLELFRMIGAIGFGQRLKSMVRPEPLLEPPLDSAPPASTPPEHTPLGTAAEG